MILNYSVLFGGYLLVVVGCIHSVEPPSAAVMYALAALLCGFLIRGVTGVVLLLIWCFTMARVLQRAGPEDLDFAGAWVAIPGALLFTLGRLVSAGITRNRLLAISNRSIRKTLEHQHALASERERIRIARELHDSVGHCLTVALLQLEMIERVTDRDSRAHEAGHHASAAVRLGLRELRRSVGVLQQNDRPLNLGAELHDLCQRFDLGFAVDLDVDRELVHGTGSSALDVAIFRVVQEGMTNTVRHARARSVVVAVRQGSRELVVRVQNDGVTTSPGITEGTGLRSLQGRVSQLGGVITYGMVTPEDQQIPDAEASQWFLQANFTLQPT